MNHNKSRLAWQKKLHEIIFEADTAAGKLFDIFLILTILLSVVAVMLDSVKSINGYYGNILYTAEWIFTILFTIEYFLRITAISKPWGYMRSFYGVVDLLAVLPTYLGVIFPGIHFLLVIRLLRVLRIFRVLKLIQYISEAKMLRQALRASGRKITIFIFTVLTLVTIMGSLMYVIEGEANGFTSIPLSIYWAIVTLTTVGYGDISPMTGLGQMLAAIIMICGYGIIAVPTGIVTVEMNRLAVKKISTQSCPECSAEGHDYDAKFCKICGAKL